MENICGAYPVNYADKCLGEVKIERLGIRFSICGSISGIDIEGPFRLAALSGGKTVPIGVMLPKGGGFGYAKLFSAAALVQLGIRDIAGFTIITDHPVTEEAEPMQTEAVSTAESEWANTAAPWQYFEEGEFRRVFSACGRALVRQDGDVLYLAVPLVKDEEFPVMPVFCLGEVWKINDELHLVFKIHDGRLLF